MSAGTCSRISAATIRSNSPSANGSASASPSFTSASAPSGTSPASAIATNMSRTRASSSASWSKATTSAPRRYISKAWRPAPQPRSSTRSPGRSPRRSKSTVSTHAPSGGSGRAGPEVRDRVVVRRGSGGSDRPPAEELLDPAAAGGAVPSSAYRVVEQRAECGGELPHVTRSHQVGAHAVGADHLGDGSRTGGDEWRRGRHQLHGRQRETFVEAGDAGHLGGAHQRDQLGV